MLTPIGTSAIRSLIVAAVAVIAVQVVAIALLFPDQTVGLLVRKHSGPGASSGDAADTPHPALPVAAQATPTQR